MARCSSSKSRAVLAGAILAFLPGCNSSEERAAAGEAGDPGIRITLPLRDDGALSLDAFAIRDSVLVGDSILVGYLMRNGGAARRLILDPRFFEVHVLGPDGERVLASTVSWAGSTGEESLVTLPRLGLVGRLFVLTCGHPGFSTIETCPGDDSLSAPGEYRVVLKYLPPSVPGDAQATIHLESDTVRLWVLGRGH